MNIIQFFRAAPMIIWMYFDLRHISENFKNIDRYVASGDVEKEKEEIFKAEWYWAKSLEKKFGARLLIEGRENLPNETALFVSNHQSNLDIIVMIIATERMVGFIAKDELAKVPIFGRRIAQIRSVFMNRNDPRQSLKAIETGAEYLRQGFNLAIFPEGTRSRGAAQIEFKKGALRPAFKAQVPIVPVTIDGSYKLWEEKGYPCHAEVRVFFHPPVETKDVAKAGQNKAAEDVERAIKEKLARYRLEQSFR